MLSRRAASVSLAFAVASGLVSAFPAAAQTGGVRTYYVVFLKRDPDRKRIDKENLDRIQADHMANINSMAERGVLVAAGPFEDEPPVISGVFFFSAPSLEEARKIALQDPTVVEGRNTVEVLAWQGPVGLGDEYRRLHKAKPDLTADMGVHPFVILRRTEKAANPDLTGQHAKFLDGLRRDGKVLAAGSLEGDASAVELVIFSRIADADARSAMAADPAVSAGALALDVHRWWCAANVFPR